MDGGENGWASVSFTGLYPQGPGEVINDGTKSNGGALHSATGERGA